MKKRDYILNLQVVNTLNIIKGNTQTIMISLAKNRGLIIKGKDTRLNKFFGYQDGVDYNLEFVS